MSTASHARRSTGDGRDGRPMIFVVDGDAGLSYLLARYAERAGVRFCELRVQPARATRLIVGPHSVLWFPSVERLEWARPGSIGFGEDVPVIVCAFHGEEARARDLGADVCAFDPLSYPDFLAALSAVGLPGLPATAVEQGSAR